jgi:dolichyl-phosphate-mannose-protein mannosyltransferase
MVRLPFRRNDGGWRFRRALESQSARSAWLSSSVVSSSSSRLRTQGADYVRRVCALICLVSAYLSCRVWTPPFTESHFEVQWLVVTAVAALIVATGPLQWVDPPGDPQPLQWPGRLPLWRNLIVGWALMLLAAGLKAAHFSPPVVQRTWVAGVLWLLVGAWLLSRRHRAAVTRGVPRSAWVWGVLIVAGGAGLRLWAIDTVPRYVHCDEGAVCLLALEFFGKPHFDWYSFVPSLSPLPAYAISGWGTYVFGFNLTAARLPDVLLGIASIAFTFDGLRRVSNLRVAVVGTILLAANHCHLAYSRIASGYIQTAFVVSYVFALFARVWTTPTYFNTALLGVGLAMGILTYMPGTMLPPLVGITMAVLWVLNPRRVWALRAPLSVVATSAIAAAALMGVALLQHGDDLFARSRTINIFIPQVMESLKHEVYHTDSTAAVVMGQAWKALRAFHAGEDTNPQYGIWRPLADRYTAALLISGAVFALLGLRQFLAANALVLTIGYLLLALGMQKTFGFERATGTLPLGMAVAAIALVQCWGTFWGGRSRWTRWGRDLCLAASVALCVAANFQIYFVEYGRKLFFGDETSEAAWVAREHADRYTVHLIDWRLPAHEAIKLILGSVTGLDNPHVLLTPADTEPATQARTVELRGNDLFVVWSQDLAAKDALLARFPDATVQEWSPPSQGPVLYLIFVGPPRATDHG